VLYEMLTGKIPYDAETPAGQLVRRITDPTPNVLELRPDLPPGVQEVIARALAKRRYVRFSTSSDMAAALDAVAKGKTPTDTLVIDRTGTPASGNVPVRGYPEEVRPRLAVKAQAKRATEGSLIQRLLVIGTAAVALAALLFFGYQALEMLGIGTGGIPPAETQPFIVPVSASDTTSTPSGPALGTVVQVEGAAQYQLPEGPPLPVTLNSEIPDLPGVRVWTSSGRLKLRYAQGPVLWLGSDTAVIVPEPAEDDQPAIQLERGSLLVKAQEMLVTTNQPEFRVEADFATLGVRYEPALNNFLVDCLEGDCLVGETNVFDLTGGVQGGYEGGALLAQEPADFAYWAAIAGAEVPTTTPTPTATATPTETPTPTATPTVTPEPTFTSAPVFVFPTQPVFQPQPTSVPQPQPTSAPRPTSAPAPTNPPAPPPTNDPNQG
jgi:hypothetical protein